MLDVTLQDRNGATALDLARKEQHQAVIDQLQLKDIDKDYQEGLALKIDIDSLKDLRKQQEKIGLEPASGFDINCMGGYRAKRQVSICQEDVENLFPYQPLEESAASTKARAAKLYHQIAIATVLKYHDQFGDVNQNLQNILSYNRYIGDIISQQSMSHSPREQRILADHYSQAEQFLEAYLPS